MGEHENRVGMEGLIRCVGWWVRRMNGRTRVEVSRLVTGEMGYRQDRYRAEVEARGYELCVV